MLYYKSKTGEIFAYENEADRQKFGAKDLTPLSDSDIEKHHTVTAETNLSYTERDWRDSELIRSDVELYKVQDSDPKAVGTVAGWREYRKALRSWPEHKDFPNKESRPVSPLIKE